MTMMKITEVVTAASLSTSTSDPMPSRRLARAMTNAPNAPTAPAYVAGK